MTHDSTTPTEALAALCASAEVVIAEGLAFARSDDPHRFASLPRDFDGGKARRRLVLDYLPAGRVRVALQLIGTQAGQERAAEVFATVLQGPIDPDGN